MINDTSAMSSKQLIGELSTVYSWNFSTCTQSDIKVYANDDVLDYLHGDFEIISYDRNTGGTLRLTSIPNIGTHLVIVQESPFNQELDLQNQRMLSLSETEKALDKLTLMAQRLFAVVGRCVKVPLSGKIKPTEVLSAIFIANQDSKVSADRAQESELMASASATSASASEASASESASQAKASETSVSASATMASTSADEARDSASQAKASETNAKTSETNAANSAKELEINLEENHYTKTQTDLKLDNKLNVKKGSISVSEIKDIEAPSSQTDSRITFGRGIQLTATGNVAGEPQPSSSIKLHTSGGVEMTTPSGGLTLNGIKIPNENDVQETVDGAIGDFLDVENKAIKVDKISPLTPTNGDGVVITADNSLSGGQAVTKGSFSPLGFNFRWEDKRDILKKRYSEITSRENHMSMVQVSTFDERLAGGLSFDQGSASLFGDSIDIRAAYSLNIEAKVMTRYYYIEGQGGKYYGIIDQKLLDEALVLKQDKLKAGGNITISEDGTISSGLGLELQVVDTLPITGVVGVLYLVPKGGSINDTHDEYVWVDTKYELIGNTSVDLSAYYTKTQIDGIIVPINSKITTIETELPTKATVASLATKIDRYTSTLKEQVLPANLNYHGISMATYPDVRLYTFPSNNTTMSGLRFIAFQDLVEGDFVYFNNEGNIDIPITLENGANQPTVIFKAKSKYKVDFYNYQVIVEEVSHTNNFDLQQKLIDIDMSTKMDKILIKDFSKEPSINFDYNGDGSSILLNITEHLNAGINVFTFTNLSDDIASHTINITTGLEVPFIVCILNGKTTEYPLYVNEVYASGGALKVGTYYKYSFDTKAFAEISDVIEGINLQQKLIDIDISPKIDRFLDGNTGSRPHTVSTLDISGYNDLNLENGIPADALGCDLVGTHGSAHSVVSFYPNRKLYVKNATSNKASLMEYTSYQYEVLQVNEEVFLNFNGDGYLKSITRFRDYQEALRSMPYPPPHDDQMYVMKNGQWVVYP